MIEGHSAWVLILAVVLSVAGLFFLKRNPKLGNGRKLPPSLPSLPIVGSLPFVNGGMDVLPSFFMKTAERLGPVFSFYSERNLVVVLNGKKAIFDTLLKQSEAFADRSDFWTEANRHNTDLRGIAFTKYNEAFRKYHKVILSIMKEFGFGVNHESDVRVWNVLDEWFVKLRSHNGGEFDIKDELVYATAKVFMRVIFGGELQPLDTYIRKLTFNANLFLSHMDPAINLAPMIRFLPRFRKKIATIDHHSKELLEGIEEAIAHFKSNPSAENCLIKRFLESQGSAYNHKDFVFILRDLCLGSSDTLAITTAWAVMDMATYPDVRIKVQKELDDNVPSDRYPSYDDKRRLPYTEAALLESMRYHTLVPFAIPHAALRDAKAGEYFIPKGTVVVPNLFSIHMDTELWKDPQNFRPERFLDDDMNLIGKENVVSFSIGKRACIGETLSRHEVFVFFASLMQHFDPLPPKGMDRVPHDMEYGLTVSQTNVHMRLISRKGR